MKHTPGPWRVVNSNLVRDSHGVCIHGDSSFLRNDANAALIAAAPEMFAALVALLPHAARVIQGTTEGQPLLDAARAAIAKATQENTP